MRSSRSCGGSCCAAARQRAQQLARALQRRAGRRPASRSARHQSPCAAAPPRASATRSSSLAPNSGLRSACASDRRVLRRDQHVEHRDQVARLGGVEQARSPRPRRTARAARASASATSRSDSRLRHSTWMSPRRDAAALPAARAPPAATGARFLLAQHFLGLVARRRQAVAPRRVGAARRPSGARRRGDARQRAHAAPARSADLGGVRPEAGELAVALRPRRTRR